MLRIKKIQRFRYSVSLFIYSGVFWGNYWLRPKLRRMLEQFLPSSDNKPLLDLQQEVFSRLSSFAESVRALGNVSLAVLIFTGIALLNTIESALNQVWR